MTSTVRLREVMAGDLEVFFEQQKDPDANYMAAFTAKDPSDRDGYMGYWTKVLDDESITWRTILYGDDIAGSVLRFEQFGKPSVSYWISKEYWGKGVATEALRQFLRLVETRPLYARAAKDNIASIRVLEKCGFVLSGEEKGFANARGEEIAEVVMKLEAGGEL